MPTIIEPFQLDKARVMRGRVTRRSDMWHPKWWRVDRLAADSYAVLWEDPEGTYTHDQERYHKMPLHQAMQHLGLCTIERMYTRPQEPYQPAKPTRTRPKSARAAIADTHRLNFLANTCASVEKDGERWRLSNGTAWRASLRAAIDHAIKENRK